MPGYLVECPGVGYGSTTEVSVADNWLFSVYPSYHILDLNRDPTGQ